MADGGHGLGARTTTKSANLTDCSHVCASDTAEVHPLATCTHSARIASKRPHSRCQQYRAAQCNAFDRIANRGKSSKCSRSLYGHEATRAVLRLAWQAWHAHAC
eukprot:6193237-Pleurochrysis_carterae.AAC.2